MKSYFEKIIRLKDGFAGSLAAYTFWGALDKVFPFILLPLFTRLFTKDDVGYYTLYQTLMIIIPPILTCDIDTSISINFFHYDKDKLSRLIFSSIIYVFVIYAIAMLIGFLLRESISDAMKFPYVEFAIIITNALFLLILSILLCILRNENKVLHYGMLSFSKTVISYGISLYLIFRCSYSWRGVIYGEFCSGLIIAVLSFILLYRKGYIKPVFEKILLKDSLMTGFPAALHNIGAWLSNSFNSMLVNVLIGIGATGRYGVGATYGLIVSFVHTSINKAYSPYVYGCLKKKQMPKINTLIKKLYVLIIGIFIMVTLIGLTLNDYIFGDTYTDVKQFIVPLVLASTLWGLYKIHVAFLFYYKRVWSITKITISTGLLNIPISYFLISNYALIGAAYASVISSVIIYIMIFLSSKKALSKFYED